MKFKCSFQVIFYGFIFSGMMFTSEIIGDPKTVEIAKPVMLATGFTFPEGPVLDKDGNLYLVNFRATMIHKVSPEGKVSVVVDIGAFNNGAIFDRVGNLFIASSGLKAILKLDRKGELSVVTAVSEGDSLLGPNDFAWDNEGRLYFTDPRGSGKSNLIGGIHFIGRDGVTRRFAGGLSYPNGIAFDLDKTHVYVSETGSARIVRFAVNPDGSAGEKELLYELPDRSVPDGMKLDVKGNLWVAVHTKGELWRISPEGVKIDSIKMPSKFVTNLTFGGADMKTMYVTCLEDIESDTGKVYTLRVPVAGVPVIPQE